MNFMRSGTPASRHPGLDPGPMNTGGAGPSQAVFMGPDFRQDDEGVVAFQPSPLAGEGRLAGGEPGEGRRAPPSPFKGEGLEASAPLSYPGGAPVREVRRSRDTMNFMNFTRPRSRP
jgi:hypothetical protein